MTLSPLLVGVGLAALFAAIMLFRRYSKKGTSTLSKRVDELELHSFIKTMQSAFRTADFNVPKQFEKRTKEGPRKVAVIVTVSCKPDERKVFDIFLDVGEMTTRITIHTSRLLKEHLESYLRNAGFEFNQ